MSVVKENGAIHSFICYLFVDQAHCIHDVSWYGLYARFYHLGLKNSPNSLYERVISVGWEYADFK